jgi:hypothetical protein
MGYVTDNEYSEVEEQEEEKPRRKGSWFRDWCC